MPDKTLDELKEEVLAAVVAYKSDWEKFWAGARAGSSNIQLHANAQALAYAAREKAIDAYYAAHKAAQTKSEGGKQKWRIDEKRPVSG